MNRDTSATLACQLYHMHSGEQSKTEMGVNMSIKRSHTHTHTHTHKKICVISYRCGNMKLSKL